MTLITDPIAAMQVLIALYTEHESLCDQLEDNLDRGYGTAAERREAKRLIAECERINELEFVAAKLVLALDPSLVDLCGVYDTADEVIDGGTTYGGGK